jgi:sulfatase maturation enzyme AslB (radical SAM superfamily)
MNASPINSHKPSTENLLRGHSAFEPLPGGDLPIFRSVPSHVHAGEAWYYAPGYLAVVDADQADAFEPHLLAVEAHGGHAAELRRHAVEAQQVWAEIRTRPFAPVCLTVYPNNECNLICKYCYATPNSPSKPAPRVALTTLRAAAGLVARNCAARSLPFTLVLHGGGEPTLDQRLADAILDAVERITIEQGLPLFRYVATNGVMSAVKAAWLAERFDLIGLSCDGPETIQARQRPLWGGESSTPFVERTAQIAHEAGKLVHVRVTVTPYSVHRQTEAAEYICRQLKPQEIHVEPVYRLGRAMAAGRDCFDVEQAEEFVAEFLKARGMARRRGVEWLASGSRPGEIHGPYCQVFRDVLHLVPGGVATACFKTVDAGRARKQALVIGEQEMASGHFGLDEARLGVLRDALRREPPQCATCFNRYHCVRDCPDSCPLEGVPPSPSFRCRVQQLLAQARLQETAEALHASGQRVNGVLGGEVVFRQGEGEMQL